MKKMLFVLCLVMLFAMFTMAQSSSSSPSSTNSTNDQSSDQSQSNPSTGSQSTGSMGSQQPSSTGTQTSGSMSQTDTSGNSMMEGCVVRSDSEFYLQPTAGGNRVKLSGSQDWSSHVGHQVRVHGTQTASSAASTGAYPSTSAAGSTQNQEFNVTRVDMISTTCPTASNPPSEPLVPK